MAGSIQGLTVIINGDATRLTKAMREARAEAGILRGHMSSLNRLLSFNPSNGALLARQQQLLNASIMQTQQRLQQLRASYAQLAPTVSSMNSAQLRQFMSLQKEITQTELRMAELRREAIQTGAAGSAAMRQWAGRLGSVNAALKTVSTQLMTASAVSGLLGYAAVRAAVDFESSFAGVRKTIVATEAEYEQLRADSIALSLAKPVSTDDINRIMELGGQLNIAREHLSKFAGVMADLNVSTDMGVDEGSLKLAQFMNITNMAQGDVDRLGATIVDLGNNSATTEDRMMNMAMRIAGAGSNIGMSAQDVLALSASLSAVGIQAEMGGNAISTVMNRIDKDVALGSSTLSTWASTAGMSAQEFKQAWTSDVTGTLLSVFKGMGEFRDEGNNINLLLKDMGINYMRQIDTMQRLSRAGDLTAQLVARANVAWDQNTALVREATQRYSTAESKIQMMKNSFNAMGVAIGQQVLPTFSGLVDGVSRAVQAFADMDDGTKEAIVGVLAFVTAIGPVAKLVQGAAGAGQFLLKTYMSLRTALNLAAAGQLTYTNMTIALSAETETEAMAEAENTAATLANASSKGVLASAASLATKELTLFNGALVLTGGELAAVVAAVGLLVVATGVMASKIAEANDPLNQLTASWQDQQDEVDRLQARYDELSASSSASSEEIWAVQNALDEQRDALETGSVTIREFNENVADAADEHARLKANIDDAIRSAENEVGAVKSLVDDVKKLAEAGAEGDTSAIEELQTKLAQLNMLMPELGLAWDSASKAITSSKGDWEALAVDAKKADLAATALEKLNEERSALGDSNSGATKNFEEAKRNLDDYIDSLGEAGAFLKDFNDEQLRAWSETSSLEHNPLVNGKGAISDLIDAYLTAKDTYDSLNSSIAEHSKTVADNTDRSLALSDAIGKVVTDQMDLAGAVGYLREQYGIEATEEELAEARAKSLAESQQEAASAIGDVADAVSEAMEEYPVFAECMAAAGVSAEGLAAQLVHMGVKAEDVAKEIEDFVNGALNGFNRLDASAGGSLDDFMANLQHNAEASVNFADNLAYLYSVADTPAKVQLVESLKQGGVEDASVAVQQLADSARNGGGAFDDYASRYATMKDDVERSSMGLIGVTADSQQAAEQFADAAGGSADRVGEIVRSAADSISSAMGSTIVQAQIKAQAAMSAYEQAIRDGKAPEAAAAIASQVAANLVIPDTSGIGRAALEGLRDGLSDGNLISQIQKAASSAANAANSAMAGKSGLDVNSPSKKTRKIGRSAAEGLELGIRDGMDDVRRAAELMAQSSAVGVGGTWRQVASTPWGSAALSGNTTINNISYIVDGVSYAEGSDGAAAVKELVHVTHVDRRRRGAQRGR